MWLYDDALISACLLHDVVEDTDYTNEDLPVSDEAKEIAYMLYEYDLPDGAELVVIEDEG